LDERGEGSDHRWAAYIRDSIKHEQTKDLNPEYAKTRWTALCLRHFDFMKSMSSPLDLSRVGFDRGFINSVTCTSEQFAELYSRLIWNPKSGEACPPTAQPIKSVQLTTDISPALVEYAAWSGGTTGGYRSLTIDICGKRIRLRDVSPNANWPRITLEARFRGVKFSILVISSIVLESGLGEGHGLSVWMGSNSG
jgi:hypothetical protein